MRRAGKKALIVIGIIVFLAIAGFFVFDFVFFAPKATLSFVNEFGQQKLDAPFKVKVEVMNLSYINKTFVIGVEIKGAEGKSKSVVPEKIELKAKESKQLEFEAVVDDAMGPGAYSAVAYAECQKSLLSRTETRIEETKRELVIAEKLVNGVVNLIDIKGIKKVGEAITINAVAKNTGEVAKPFSVSGSILNPNNESVNLSMKDFTLKIEESKKFSYDYTVPEAVAGKFRVVLKLYSGESGAADKKQLSSVEEEIQIAPRIIKASVEAIKTRGKLKSGETVGFDIDIKNTGDKSTIFSAEVNMTDPAGKTIDFPPKDFRLGVDDIKTVSHDYPVPMTGSHGRYKINVNVYAGEFKDLNKKKVAEMPQEFTIAERVTKASVSAPKFKGKMKVGETLTIETAVKNTGELAHAFAVNASINTGSGVINVPGKTIQLEVGDSKLVTFDCEIPITAPAGTFEVKTAVWNQMEADGKLTEQYEEKSATVKMAGPNISGNAVLSTITEKKFGETAKIQAKFSNTGEAAHEFFIKLEVKDPSGKITTVTNEKVDLEKAAVKDSTADFAVDSTMPDGDYTVLASIWDRIGDDGQPAGKYAEDKQNFKVIDMPPVIGNLVATSPVAGKEGTVTVNVKDDKEIRSVILVYQGPGMTDWAKDSMIKLKGSKKDAQFTQSTRKFTFSGSYMFYVEVSDSKGQKTKTEQGQSKITEK